MHIRLFDYHNAPTAIVIDPRPHRSSLSIQGANIYRAKAPSVVVELRRHPAVVVSSEAPTSPP
jgi:hypothetical protein